MDHHHHHHAHDDHSEEPMTPEEAVRSLLILGQKALDAKDYEAAIDAYASALTIEPNETASLSLGSLYARGLGVRKNYLEAAKLFHQAELLGNVMAGKLCGKCMYDYIHQGFDGRRPADLYAAMTVFVTMVYPEAENSGQEIASGLFAIASTHLSKEEFVEAAKVFRAGAEFANDGFAQYYLGLLYNAGAGVQKSDLAALYWLDRAVDNGAGDIAVQERDSALDALRRAFSAEEFSAMMETLAKWCEEGTPDVPVDHDKVERWRELAS